MENIFWTLVSIVAGVVLLLVGFEIGFWVRMWCVPDQNKDTREAVRRVEKTVNEVRLRVSDMSSNSRHPKA